MAYTPIHSKYITKSKFDGKPFEPHRTHVFHAASPAVAFNTYELKPIYDWDIENLVEHSVHYLQIYFIIASEF